MIAPALAWDKVRGRPWTAGIAALAVALGVALLVILSSARETMTRRLDDLNGLADILVGPKGGSIDLFLSAGLNATPPSGRAPVGLLEDLAADPRVERVAPVMLEDDYRGWPVVGTTDAYPIFAHNDGLADFFRTGERIAVVGQVAARALGLSLGDSFVTTHDRVSGIGYEVVEILGPRSTVADRSLFVPLGAASGAHAAAHVAAHSVKSSPRRAGALADSEVAGASMTLGDSAGGDSVGGDSVGLEKAEEDANALLVALKTPLDLLPMMRELNELKEVTAVDPRAEAARLHAVLGGADRYLVSAGVAIMALAVLGMVAVLASQAEERRREAAILRALGASFGHVVAVEIIHAALIAGCGAVVGVAGGGLFAGYLGLKEALTMTDVGLVLFAVTLAVVVAALASLPLYRVDLDDALRPDR